MALEDYMEPEVGIAVALTAIVASPTVRTLLRRGAVYGLAGALLAGDVLSTLAQGVKRGVQQAAAAPEAVSPVLAVDDGPVAAPEVLHADDAEPLSAKTAPKPPAAPKPARKTAEAAGNE